MVCMSWTDVRRVCKRKVLEIYDFRNFLQFPDGSFESVVNSSSFIVFPNRSWGPLGWLIPSEIQPLETRSAGQSFATAVNFLVAFIIGQSFLATLCAMRWGAFLFYAAFVILAVVFAAFCMAETKVTQTFLPAVVSSKCVATQLKSNA